jgi:hypothetical protein
MQMFWWLRVAVVEAVQHPAQSVAVVAVVAFKNFSTKEFCCNLIP